MILLNADKIRKRYTERPILENICLSINEGDKIGLIGVNGTGKSTLLKILAGKEEAEGGTIVKTKGVRIGYLPQNPVFHKDLSVLEQVLQDVSSNERESKEYECKTVLTKLGITDFDKPVSLLSGGQKKRVALAGVLVSPVEILILGKIPDFHGVSDFYDAFIRENRTHNHFQQGRFTIAVGPDDADSIVS